MKREYGVPFDMIAKGARGIGVLTEGKTYRALNGFEEGIFADRPFVSVICDDGKRRSYHAARFEPISS